MTGNLRDAYTTGKKWYGPVEKWYGTHNFCKEIPVLFWIHRRLWTGMKILRTFQAQIAKKNNSNKIRTFSLSPKLDGLIKKECSFD